MIKNENLKNTIYITFFLFSFIAFLIYLLYCYAYYDKSLEETYYKEIADYNYNYFYDNLIDKDGLDREDFDKTVKLMTSVNELKNVFYLYYKNSDIYSLEEFLSIYYYGDYKISSDDVVFSFNGKTSLFKRKAIFYDEVHLNNGVSKSTWGVLRNIQFNVEENSTLKVDNNELSCDNGVCKDFKIFGGLHEIIYESNNYQYYGIVNVSKDKQVIDITNLDSLVRIDLVTDDSIVIGDNVDAEVEIGSYKLSKCYLDSGCPTTKKTYLKLYSDGSCEFYTYINLDKAGDYYIGKYNIENNFLIMNFDSHVYEVFDYDTKQSTNINGNIEIEMRYKIEDDGSLVNDSYKFVFNGE